ncbi:MAG: thiamine pyrophosphate-binding protein [Clostridia bacterium]|nr:thiamine pyrophosphate-binding protein [Clostridia bacterium]
MKEYKGADLLMKCLAELDVTDVFGMGGHGCMGLCDGLYLADEAYGIKGYIIHDESVGASAAGGYFKATGKPGVLLVTNGPGMMQAIPGIVEQAASNTPVLVICGDVPTAQWGWSAEEELDIHCDDDQTSTYRAFAKRIYHVVTPEQIPMTIARAYTTAMSGRPGVVLVNVPVDVQSKEIPEEMMTRDYQLKKHAVIDHPRGSRAATEKAAKLLMEAEHPMIVCGVGAVISDASEEVKELATLLDCPVGSAYMGQAIIGGNDPLYAGRVGGWGNKYANEAAWNSDVIITLGNKYDEDETGAWEVGNTYNVEKTKLIHVHIDPREIGRNYPVEVGIHGDPKEVLKEIISIVKASGKTFSRGTAEKVAKGKAEYFAEMAEYRNCDTVPINPHRFVKDLEEVFPKGAVQVGAAICARNYYAHDDAKTAYYGYGMDLIGTCLAQALGFAVGNPGRKVVSVEGDGGFLIHSSMLATAAEYNLPITWIIVNNSSYGTVWGLQRQYFENRSILTEFRYDKGDVYVPNYAQIAEGFHVKGFRVEKPEEIKPALEAAFAWDGPTLVDVVVDRVFSSTPPTVSRCGWDKYYPTW